MRQLTTLLTLILLTALTANAKVRLIYIKKTLQEAKIIKTIIVIGYNDSTMFYRLVNSKDTLRINSKIKQSSESFRQTLIDKNVASKVDLAGKWPDVGQKVLIVISDKDRVSLFAIVIGDDYRFWDPNSIPFANSIFAIPKERPYKRLANCNESELNKDGGFWICTDGCLVIALDLKERG